ncbi:MAG TPA: response regulator [Gemmataceae bacterium]|jgi:CheY-like chemotaxis protein
MQPPDSSCGALRILVADDFADSAVSLKILLTLWGHEVIVVHWGREALAVAQIFRPQVVLLDFELPDLNGGDVAKGLRQLPGFERVLIVAITGHDQDEESFQSYLKLFDHCLRKPFNLTELERLLAAYSIVADPGTSPGEAGT